MEILLKIIFLFNCIFYKRYEYNNYLYSLYILNIINYFLSFSIVLNFIYLLFKDYDLQNLLILAFYIIDPFLVYSANKIGFLKNIGKNFDLLLKPKYKKISPYLYFLSFLCSISVAITSLFFDNIKIINNSWNVYFNKYCLFFVLFYSNFLKLNICITFFLIISNISNFLKEFIDKKIKSNIQNFDINSISIEFMILKRNYNKTIVNFNNIMSNMIGFYSIPSFYILSNIDKKFDFMYYNGFSIFLLMSGVFHYYLSKIDSDIDYLKSICVKNRSISDYISRRKNIYFFESNAIELENINTNELSFKNYLVDVENSQSIDWIIFDKIINEKWRDFEIFGVKINNSSIIIKIFSLFLILILGKQII